MLRRALLVFSLALAVAGGAAASAGVTGKISVSPSSPVTGANAKISVRVTATSRPAIPAVLYLRATSPRGASLRVLLSKGTAGSWRTAFVFADRGTWHLSVIAGKGGAPKAGTILAAVRVLVRK